MSSPIAHCPQGNSHPYVPGPQSRLPLLPIAGQPVTIGISCQIPLLKADAEVRSFHAGSPCVELIPLQAVLPSAPAGAEGHLSLAQQASGEHPGWTLTMDEAPTGQWEYRFRAIGQDEQEYLTPWYSVTSARLEACDPAPYLHLHSSQLPQGERDAWMAQVRAWHIILDDHPVGLRIGLPLDVDDRVIGFGERYDALNQRGRTFDIRVFEQYKSQGQTPYTYFPIPFGHIIGKTDRSVRIIGLKRPHVDAASSDPNYLTIQGEFISEKASSGVELWEKTPQENLAAYLDKVGAPQLLPEWVHGLWASGNEWNTQAAVMEQVERHEKENIPISTLVIEAWSDEEGFCAFRDSIYHGDPTKPYEYNNFEFPTQGAWPDPKGLVDELHKRGIHLVLWQIPLQKNDDTLTPFAAAQRDALLDSGHVVRTEDGAPYKNRGWWFPGAYMPDLTTEQGAQWWAQWRRYLVRDIGIDGFKTDGGEHAWGADLHFGGAPQGEAGANAYPVAYARAYGELLRSEGKAPLTFSRAGYEGSQAHGAFWAGDENSTWEAFASSMRAGINASACGVLYWGWDIAGFSGPLPDPELYLRAWGASTFLPIMQYHSEYNGHRQPSNDRTPWNIAQQSGQSAVVDIARYFTQLRTALVPYIAEQAKISVRERAGLMRPLCFLSRDARIWDYDTQFALGNDILVRPLHHPSSSDQGELDLQSRATASDMFIPEGAWIDPWNGEKVSGPGIYARSYSMREVPLLIRQEAWGSLRDAFESLQPTEA